MECNTTISLNIKADEDRNHFIKALEAIKSISITDDGSASNEISAANEYIGKTKFNINAEDIYKHLKRLDTNINNIEVGRISITVSLFPWDYPEELCNMLFPLLHEGGAERLECESTSEYGEQTLAYRNGRMFKTEEEYDL